MIQGGGSKTIPGGERNKHSKHIHGAGVPAQPPTLSQAPVGTDAKSFHSSIYVTAGKSQAHPHVNSTLSRSGAQSPRPGSVNTTSNFRREHGPSSNSSMLRSMSEDDLRHHKRKHHEGGRPHHPHRNPYERERMDERVTHSGGEFVDPHAPPGLLVHQIPHGAGQPPSHFSPATSYTRLPPVMSITPLEHSKAAHEEAQKSHHYGRMPAAHARELERTMQLHERERERAHHVERGLKAGGPRVPVFIPGAHEMPPQPGLDNWHDNNPYGCKSCGMRFSHKHAMETHLCQAGSGKKHASPYHCAMCQIAFHEPREMHEHMVTHHREALGAVGIPTERPPFGSRAFSKNHMKMHDKMPPQPPTAVAPHPTLGVEPNVPTKDLNATKPMTDCMKCNQRFAKPTDLTKHLNTPGECPGT